jgi:hypothetical protein
MMKSGLMYRDCLTNEILHKSFRSQFDLVLHAIRVAGGVVHSGQYESELHMRNIAADVLSDIAEGARLEPIVKQQPCSVEECTEEAVTKTKKGKKTA